MAIALTIKNAVGGKEKVPLPTVQKVLDNYGKAVTAKARAVLAEKNKNATGNLSADTRHEVLVDAEGDIILDYPFRSAPYAMFVEKGVRGAIDDSTAPNSPFKFGSGTGPAGGLRPSIRQWILDKPVNQWRNLKSGRFMSYDSMARMISRKVFLHGLAPTNFLGPSLKMLYKRYKGKLEDAFSEDISNYYQKTLDDQEANLVMNFKLL